MNALIAFANESTTLNPLSTTFQNNINSEQADEMRYTKGWKEKYPQRKQTIERVFADCKEKSILRYTRLRGIKKNQHQVPMSLS